ncbi:DNA primase [Anaerococcus degeneri]|uniref:DNA primase n=1 Tax=Anaerococcus degeneri TaxID=361500 RepID=A0ABS7YZC9_9FIRM|nr:DNA primase [Anaerococcus degeneri]MBP2014881.1 DNA primase [Anaerococcus degeneri]MCA2097090.1 DNA primase [Anaerococcus degeneri]
MRLISDDMINQIKENSDIVDIIGEYVDLKKAGSSFKGLCPFHNEKTPSFTVDRKKQLFHCFGCGAGGDVVSFIMQKEGLSYPDSLKYLAQKAGINLVFNESPGMSEKRKKLYEINKDIMMYFYKNLLTNKEPQDYLLKRGLRSNIVNTFMLGFAKDSWDDLLNFARSNNIKEEDLLELGLIAKSKNGNYYDKYRNRLIFPIIDTYGRIIGFGGRAIDNTMPKYLNSPESEVFKKRFNLYGLNIFKKQNKRDLILVEGYMDVIALNNNGIDIAVASLGTAFTVDQAKLAKRYADNIYICYDSDSAGIKATKRAIEIFREADIGVNIIQLGEGLDPDDFVKKYGKDAFEKKMDEALDEYNYAYEQILNGYSEANENEKFEKLNLFIGFLASIKQDLTREIFINKVSSLFEIDKQTLKGAISKYNNKHHQEKIRKDNFPEPNIVVEEKVTNISAHELEILRLIFNQLEDYKENADYFDKYLINPKALNFRDFLINKEVNKFDKADVDYRYMLDYVMDDKNPIVVSELKDKINLYERLQKRKNLKGRSINSKGRDNEQR